MKNLVNLLFLSILALATYAQKSDKPKTSAISLSGGLWVGMNKSTTFVGFIGPKFSITFPLDSKTKVEIGVNGIPGATLGKNPKFGLAIGNTIMLKHQNWKVKPIVGLAVLKTEKWEVVYGIGFLF